MSALEDARAHLKKAGEFLEVAEFSLELDRLNAAASNAVISGINSKDAICLKRLGTTEKSDNHADAAKELSRAGRDVAALAAIFSRLLAQKSKAQYQLFDVAASAARTAVKHADRMFEAAVGIVGE